MKFIDLFAHLAEHQVQEYLPSFPYWVCSIRRVNKFAFTLNFSPMSEIKLNFNNCLLFFINCYATENLGKNIFRIGIS